ncbi:MAG TPA: hypothetical protein VFI37_15385, partial [Gaiellaceae bacterium]|nr:hypothetical protein [Gaiellaceae bacterium]
ISVAAPILFGAAGRGAAGRERAGAVAAATTLGYTGFLAGPPLVGGIAQGAGLRVAFAALAGLALFVAASVPRLALGTRAAARSR